jgi:hypothetical protein
VLRVQDVALHRDWVCREASVGGRSGHKNVLSPSAPLDRASTRSNDLDRPLETVMQHPAWARVMLSHAGSHWRRPRAPRRYPRRTHRRSRSRQRHRRRHCRRRLLFRRCLFCHCRQPSLPWPSAPLSAVALLLPPPPSRCRRPRRDAVARVSYPVPYSVHMAYRDFEKCTFATYFPRLEP